MNRGRRFERDSDSGLFVPSSMRGLHMGAPQQMLFGGGGGGGGSSGDPYWSDVILLLTAEGGTIADSGPLALTQTLGGSIAASTTQTLYQSHSILIDASSKKVRLKSSGYDNGLKLPGDFTIEAWVYTGSNSWGYNLLESGYNEVGGSGAIMLRAISGSARFWLSGSDSITKSGIAANTWTHLAICRQGTTTRLFVGGAHFSGANYSASVIDFGKGYWTLSGATSDTGYVDAIRITKAARYTSDFTPAAFPVGP